MLPCPEEHKIQYFIYHFHKAVFLVFLISSSLDYHFCFLPPQNFL